MVQPWLDAGYPCTIVDLQHPRGETTDGLLTRVGCDVADYLPPREAFSIVFAVPPCTHLAISGARWFQEKGLGSLVEALRLVEACRRICEWADTRYLLENPVGVLSTYWRKPDFMFDPRDFGGYLEDRDADAYTKRTCLWTGGGFEMPEPDRVEPTQGSKMHFISPGPNRADLRSVTPAGFAQAVFLANSRFARQEHLAA